MKEDAELAVAYPAASPRPPTEDRKSVTHTGLLSPVQAREDPLT